MMISALDAIRAEIPEVAKDLRLNLSAVLDAGTLAPAERWGVAIAVALASRSRRLAEALIASRPEEVTIKTVEDAVAAAALMGMSNVFYRFRHLVGKPSYEQKPPHLRMQRLAQARDHHGSVRALFAGREHGQCLRDLRPLTRSHPARAWHDRRSDPRRGAHRVGRPRRGHRARQHFFDSRRQFRLTEKGSSCTAAQVISVNLPDKR